MARERAAGDIDGLDRGRGGREMPLASLSSAGMAIDVRHGLPRSSTEEPADTAGKGSGLAIREFIVAWVALAVLGLVVYAPHVRHGGFYLDDWANAATTLYPPKGGALAAFSNLTLYRPVLVLYVPLTYFVLGTHMAYQLAWAASLAVFVSAMLYGVLRSLGVPKLHAWLPAALGLLYPWSDSTRLWETADQATLSMGLTFAGLWLAITGLRRKSWRLHACATVLYLTSILTYEITVPLIAAAGLLYVMLVGWRTARWYWAADLVVVVAGSAWVGTQNSHESFGISADLRHAYEIVTSGGTILGRTLIPVGTQNTTLALVLLLVFVLTGAVGHIAIGKRPPQTSEALSLRGWLLLAAAGLATAALGWVMFIPANPYYTPSIYGVTNRVNALAGFGLVVFVYAGFGIVGALGVRMLPRKLVFGAAALAPVFGLVLAGAYIHVLDRHIGIWNAAFRAEMAGIGEMRMRVPKLAPDTTMFTSGYPAYQTLGVPIFSANWDINGMVKLQYKDGSLSAYPILPGELLMCGSQGVSLAGAGAPAVVAPYGTALLFNVVTGEHVRPKGRKRCSSVAARYVAGPMYLSYTY